MDSTKLHSKDPQRSRRMVKFFASPEAAAAVDLMNNGDEDDINGKKQNDCVDFGIDIPLSSPRGSKENAQAGLEEIIKNYSTPDMKPKPSVSRWRRASLCVSLCNKLEKEMQLPVRQIPTSSHFPSPAVKRDGIQVPKPPRSRSPSPRQQIPRTPASPRRVGLQFPQPHRSTSPNGAVKSLRLRRATIPQPSNLKDPTETMEQLLQSRVSAAESSKASTFQEKNKAEECTTNVDQKEDTNDAESRELESCGSQDNENDPDDCKINSENPSSSGDSKNVPCKTSRSAEDISESESSARLRHRFSGRFGRRFSLPLSGQLLPTPPSLSNFQKTSESGPARLELPARMSTPRPPLARRPSLSSNLQTNRAIVTELIQERSSTISSLSVSKSCDSDASSNYSDESSVQMPPIRPRLMNRRASLACTSLLREFAEKQNADQDLRQKKSSSLDSLNVPIRRRPSPIAEYTEYIELNLKVQDLETYENHSDTTSTDIKSSTAEYEAGGNSLQDSKSLIASSDSGIGSSDDYMSHSSMTSVQSEIVHNVMPKNCRRGRRMSLPPSLQDTRRTSQSTAFYAASSAASACRSDAQIVQSVEEEIRQRILKRKQQIKEHTGGGAATLQRMHDRAANRTPGGRLKRVMEDLNGTRTTAELLQMANAKTSAKTESLCELK